MPLSLRTKVFLPFLILMTVLIGYLYWQWMPRSLANMEHQYHDATERHLDSVVEGVIPLLLGHQLDTIYENFDALLKKNSDWASIRLTDAAGMTLYPFENIPTQGPAADKLNMHTHTKRITYLNMDLGTLTVAVDLSPHLAEWKREFFDAVSAMLIVAAVIILSTWVILELKVVQPVKALGQASSEMAQGKFDSMRMKAGNDEVGHLVNSFNIMREKLAASYNLLRQSEQKNRAITTTANDAIIMMDMDGNISFWNAAAESIFGYKADEVFGRYLHGIIAPDRYTADYKKGLHDFSETGEGPTVGKTVEMTARRKDGAEFPVELSLSALRMNDKWHAIGIVRDITHRKMAGDRLLASLKEKELLLQEIHHRVKNNMQVISSLLDIQKDYVRDKQPHEIFGDIKNRINSMSLVHEKLYQSRDFSKIDFNSYLSSLISSLYSCYHVDISTVALHLDVKDIEFNIDTAIPCGLIVNELVTNSLKYAFPAGRTGEISVTIHSTGKGTNGQGTYEMKVKDNGVGIPGDIVLKDIKTLGLYLVNTLVELQLLGTIELKRDHGTEYDIRFHEIRYKKRV